MRFVKIGIALACLSTFLVIPSQAQGRPAGVSSLAEMPCQTIQGRGQYGASNYRITIGREMLRSFAYLGALDTLFGPPEGISQNEPTAVACELVPNGSDPYYQRLNLRFGLRQGDRLVKDSVRVRLTVYQDGDQAKTQVVGPGKIYSPPLDVSQTSSISLEATCLKPPYSESACPNIWFVSDNLQE